MKRRYAIVRAAEVIGEIQDPSRLWPGFTCTVETREELCKRLGLLPDASSKQIVEAAHKKGFAVYERLDPEEESDV